MMSSFTVENIFGIGSFRLCAGFPSSIKTEQDTSIHSYECPINGCLQIYDFSNNKRNHFEHVYDDIIVVMLYNALNNQVLTCSYSGKIIIWSSNYKKRFVEQTVRIDHVHYGYWTRDGTSIYLCSRFDGTILALNYNADYHSLTENWLRHWATPHADFNKVQPKLEHHLPSLDIAQNIETSNTYVAGSIGYEFVVCTALRRHIFAVLQRPQEHVRIHQLDLHTGHLLHDLKLEPAKNQWTFLCGTTEMLLDKNTGEEYFAIGLQSGVIFLINSQPLAIHRIINANGTPQAMIWWNTTLLTVGYISGIVNVFSLDGILLGCGEGAPTTAVCHLQWDSPEENHLWIGGYMGLALVKIEFFERLPASSCDKVVFTIINTTIDESQSELSKITLNTVLSRSLHETAGCGLFFDEEKNEIHSGDLSGHIFQWSIDQTEPVRHVHIEDSVRCFISNKLVGTLSGSIYNIENGETVENFDVTVICAAWNREKSSCLIGLGDGRLIDFQTKKIVGLHENHAEIWSVCWSPDEEFCATASEDQTTCLWKIGEEQMLIDTLRGHTTAVTGVQWKKQRIYTCADDRTVRIYEKQSENYSCIHVLRTPKSLFGWFTLTYLQVDEDENLIICSTQNGYLVIWRDELKPSNDLPILCKKIHFGSLEGLVYEKTHHRVLVVSSDCSVTCLRLKID